MGENFAHFSAVIYTQGTTTNKRSSQPTSQLKQLNELDKNLANPFESVVALQRGGCGQLAPALKQTTVLRLFTANIVF